MAIVESLEPPIVMAASDWTAAAFGLVGALIGGTISLAVAWQARKAAERSWIRDSRRQIYDRFLTKAQQLHVACEACQKIDRDEASVKAVQQAYLDFFQVYVVVQTVAERPVVDASRIHGYRLHELRDEAVGSDGVLNPPDFDRVSELVRYARHDTIDSMRAELRLGTDSVAPPNNFNAFSGTNLEDRFVSKEREPPASDPGKSPNVE